MRIYRQATIFLIALLFLGISCKRAEKSTEPPLKTPLDVSSENVALIDTALLRSNIEKIIGSIVEEVPLRVADVPVYSVDIISDFYIVHGFNPGWIDQVNVDDAIMLIQEAVSDGLNPEDYHLDIIQSLTVEIKSKPEPDLFLLAQRDVILTDAIFTLVYHMAEGKTDPYAQDPNWNYDKYTVPTDFYDQFFSALEFQKLPETIREQRSTWAYYQNMRNSLSKYTQMAENGGWESMPVPDFKKLEPGDTNAWVVALRKRLEIEGDYLLPQNNFVEDSVYDINLTAAVKSFQQRHNLLPDGIIGKSTIDRINVPVERKIDIIKLNLERLRWLRHDFPNKTILVNIANFELFLFQNKQFIYGCRVAVGKPYTKTPVFQSTLRYLDFNPDWTVPVSIAVGEILPKLKADPAYLQNNNMELLDVGGAKVDPFSIDFSAYSRGRFPFTIRQKPGKGNALGTVKFIFPNKHSVFLHDTPSRYLFNRESRAFSHGCIRVENPLRLAEILLADSSKWSMSKINAVIANGQTQRVLFKEEIQVMILYLTHITQADGKACFYEDVYDRDNAVLKILKAPNEFPEVRKGSRAAEQKDPLAVGL